MARPFRIEFAGAVYHITARGNARQDIFEDDCDREAFLDYLAKVCVRHHWLCHAYCLMSNHYHLLVETANPSLSKGMRHLNGEYTQYYNRRHRRVGHLFQKNHGVSVYTKPPGFGRWFFDFSMSVCAGNNLAYLSG